MPTVTALDVGSTLTVARDAFRGLRPTHHAAALLVILATLVLLHFPAVVSRSPLGDEIVHEVAYGLAARGHSPYDEADYVYPPSLLRLGAAARALDLPSAFLPLRIASLVGLSVLLWSAASWLAGSPRQRLLAALLYAALAPGIHLGIELGNVSFAVGGLIVGALLLWDARPGLSGLLLGVSLLVKPLAPGAVVTLFAEKRARGWRHVLTAAVPLAATALFLLFDPELGPFLRQGSTPWVLASTASVHRLLEVAGVRALATPLTLLLLVFTAYFARRFVHDTTSRFALALAACVSVTPVVWNHTLVLTAPLQAMAATLSIARFRVAQGVERRQRGWEAAGVALAIAAVVFSAGATGIDDQSLWFQVAGSLPPIVAPSTLAAYVLHFHRPLTRANPGPPIG